MLGYFQAVRRCKPDIVHVHYASNPNAWMMAVVDRHPLVVSVMGGDILFEEQGKPTPRSRWLTTKLLESADFITSSSNSLTAVLKRLGGFDKKVIRIFWGVDLEIFRRVDVEAVRRELGIQREDEVIFSPKALHPFYNIHLIVEAMPAILHVHPRATLIIAGEAADAAYKAKILESISRLQLQNHVVLVGKAKNEDMPLYYSLAHVVVGIPPSDGMPLTLLEAMACEAPHVLARLPRYAEIVAHEVSAYFVDISAEGVATGVIRLLSDTELREGIAQEGLQIARAQADLQEQVSHVEKKYYELLDSPRNERAFVERFNILLNIILYSLEARLRVLLSFLGRILRPLQTDR